MTKGKFGTLPEDYLLFKAAQFCSCPPWVLVEQSVWWKLKALDYSSAEEEAAAELAKRT